MTQEHDKSPSGDLHVTELHLTDEYIEMLENACGRVCALGLQEIVAKLKRNETVDIKDLQTARLDALGDFDFDTMVMMGWAADIDFKITRKNVGASLVRWIKKHKDETSSIGDFARFYDRLFETTRKDGEYERHTAAEIGLEEFIDGLIENAQTDGLGKLVRSELNRLRETIDNKTYEEIEKLAPRMNETAEGGEEQASTHSHFTVRRFLQPFTLHENESPRVLAGLRIVRGAGMPLVQRSGDRESFTRERVDLICVCRVVQRKRNGNTVFVVKGFQGQFQEANTRLLATAEKAKQATVTAIMARNLSHNIGSHVLAAYNAKHYGDGGNDAFIQYLQKRMDFLATMASGGTRSMESLWFFNEFWGGFLANYPLLDLLVRGQEYRVEDLRFFVKIAHGNERDDVHVLSKFEEKSGFKKDGRFMWRIMENFGDCTCDPGELPDDTSSKDTIPLSDQRPDDFLIAVPGGSNGRHAFYLFLENFMRNAAKYNEKRDTFNVYLLIDVSQENGPFHFQVWDNLSRVNDFEFQRIQNGLAQEVIALTKDEITPQYENLGLTEMREAVSYLQGTPGFTAGFGSIPKVGTENTELRASMYQCGSTNCLSYEFTMQPPAELLIVDPDNVIDSNEQAAGFMVCPSIDALGSIHHNHHTTVLLSQDSGEKLVEDIKWWKRPTRTLVCDNIDNFSNKSSSADWQDLHISCYRKWLIESRLKRRSATQTLILSFDGVDRTSIIETWSNLMAEMNLDFFNFLLLQTKAAERNGIRVAFSNIPEIETESDVHRYLSEAPENSLILYDNHDEIRSLLEGNEAAGLKGLNPSAIGFAQTIGSTCVRIFNLLSAPPGDYRAAQRLIYGLLEAGLTKILMIEERIAESLIKSAMSYPPAREAPDNPFFKDLIKTQGIHVTSRLNLDGREYWLSNSLETMAKDTENMIAVSDLVTAKLDEGGWGSWVGESGEDSDQSEDYDMIVIHQGVIDTVFSKKFDRESKDWFQNWSQKSGAHFVLTSGRGQYPKFLPRDVAFLEFSGLQDSMVSDFSKYHLVKSLMASKGGSTQ